MVVVPAVNPIDRRQFLAASTTTAASAGAVALGLPAAEAAAQPNAALTPTARRLFRHGVASGDPLPDRVVLWTRVTPTEAATPGSGVGPRVDVRWQVARDRRFDRVVAQGRLGTGPARDHTVKVDATGLAPGSTYWYRFVVDGHRSAAGRTRTAPSPLAEPRRLRFGVVSCANWQAGFFAAYRHLAGHDLDAVLHLGDYLYEYAPGQYGAGQDNEDIRKHRPAREMVSLADYRQRHAQYKTDPDLQTLHAAAPWVVTWDDHESSNDAYRSGAENHQPADEGRWRPRRERAQRAYDEWMPVRLSGTSAVHDGERIYRRLRFGLLADLSMLDLRTYRDKQVAQTDPAVDDPDRSITGDAQMGWLKDQLDRSPSQWKLVGNSVMISPVQFPPLPDLVGEAVDTIGLLPPEGATYNTDQWDGYTADRRELFDHLRDQGIRDTVFLTGDIHSGWACDLPIDAGTYPASETVGVELVCTSVTSNNLDDITGSPPRTTSIAVEEAVKANNRHVKYLNFDDHGYSVLDVTPARVQMDYYVLADRTRRDSGARWSTGWKVPAGQMRVRQADRSAQGAASRRDGGNR